jgi:GxxExxY protein
MEPQRTPKTQIRASQDRPDVLSRQTIGCALLVMRIPGTGFLEKVHENALVHKLRKGGLTVAQQHRLVVRYDAVVVGDYIVDLLVEDSVLVELKVTRAIADIHHAQCLNYLKASVPHLWLLPHFGRPRLDIRRTVSNF